MDTSSYDSYLKYGFMLFTVILLIVIAAKTGSATTSGFADTYKSNLPFLSERSTIGTFVGSGQQEAPSFWNLGNLSDINGYLQTAAQQPVTVAASTSSSMPVASTVVTTVPAGSTVLAATPSSAPASTATVVTPMSSGFTGNGVGFQAGQVKNKLNNFMGLSEGFATRTGKQINKIAMAEHFAGSGL
jgi:hypothetical protein